MSLNLIKLCVGIETPEELGQRQAARLEAQRRQGRPSGELFHRTRMMPRRKAELLDGGSIYWVIKGEVRVRQRILDLRPVVDGDGVPRCDILLDPALSLTRIQPRRPFQGWRYLEEQDAPKDIGALRVGAEGLSEGKLVAELAELGLV